MVAVGIVAGLAATAALVHYDVTAWWLLPAAVALLLTGTLMRAVGRR